MDTSQHSLSTTFAHEKPESNRYNALNIRYFDAYDSESLAEDCSVASSTLPPTPVKRYRYSKNFKSFGEDNFSEDDITIEDENTCSSISDNHRVQRRLSTIGNCTECGLRITSLGDACEAMGCIYHNACFICCCCRRSLRGKVFYKDNSKVYCEEDYLYCGFQRTAEKCVVCGHIIADLILQALGQYYHPGCFRCNVCNESLDELPYTVDENGVIYCLRDYNLVYAPRCAKCGIPILAPQFSSSSQGNNEIKRIFSMDKEFHIDCYKCDDCNVKLGDSNPCYPLFETVGSSASLVNMNPNICLLCLSCHIARIGATPASGQEFHTSQSLPRFNTSNSSSPLNKNSPTGGWFNK